MGRTLFWFVVSVGITVGLSVLFWFVLDWPVFFGFLFLPFLFGAGRLFGRGGEAGAVQWRTCPRCGFRSADPDVQYCPRDGQRLE